MHATPPSPRLANAPCSWGVIGGLDPAIPGLRMLDELAEAGYHGTELGDFGFLPTDPERLRRELEARHLTMLGGFVAVPLAQPHAVAAALPDVLRVARLLAAVATAQRPPLLILADVDGSDPRRVALAGRLPADLRLSTDDARRFAAQAQEIADRVADATGLATAFHPHAAGWIETPDEVDRLLAATTLSLVFDTAHHSYGCGVADDGSLSAAGVARYGERIATVHLKDCSAEIAARARREGWSYPRAVGAGLYTELGRGSIDFAAVLAALAAFGYDDWFTVEQDVFPGMGTPLESAQRNRAFLRRLGLG
jgi:inosose dehydratase